MAEKPANWYLFDSDLLAQRREDLKNESDDALEEAVMDGNQCETHYAFQLIALGAVEPNVFGSSEWLAEVQERFKRPDDTPVQLSLLLDAAPALGFTEDPPEIEPETEPNLVGNGPQEALSGLNEQWNTLRGGQSHELRELMNKVPNFHNLTTAQAFMNNVLEFGEYPTPEILLAIAKAFELYFVAAGALTLEEVFFGRPVKRAGNFAKRSKREQRYLIFHDTVRRERAISEVLEKPCALQPMAEYFLRQEREDFGKGYTDSDTFLRGYREWKAKHPDLAPDD